MRELRRELIEALEAGVRRPDYRIYAFDIAQDDYTAVITGTYTQTPLDLTDYISEVQWTPKELRFTLRDADGSLHPDTGAFRTYLRDGCILRLLEGDARVSTDFWVWTFTGALKGQIGWQASARGEGFQANLTAFSRESTQSYNRRQITSREYTMGTDLGVMVHDLAITFMGLSEDEYRIPNPIGWAFHHRVNQIAQLEPWNAIAVVLEAVCLVPWFDGEGRLRSWTKNLSLAPVRVLPDNLRIYSITIPEKIQDNINKVTVTFLDSNLEKVEGFNQKLGDANITTGFFTMQEKLDTFWSDDKKQRAGSTYLKVIKSVNANLLPVGSESYQQVDDYHGEITIDISIWVPTLATLMVAEYLAAAFIPDKSAPGQPVQVVPVTGTGTTVAPWPTIPWGKVLQAQASIAIMLIMMCLGSAQYEVWGIPFDYAYPERKSIAIVDGLDYWQEIPKEIKNDFVGSWDQADTVAVVELIFVCSQALQRTIVLDDDLTLEPGDIVQIPDGRRIFAEGLSKTVKRGEVPKLVINGFKVLTA